MPTRTWCTREKVAATINLLALPLADQRRCAKEPLPQTDEGEESPYGLNPLQRRPLVRLRDDVLLAPAPHLILSCAFEGAIWMVRDSCVAEAAGREAAGKRALDAYGDAVEGYVGRLLTTKYGHDCVLAEQRNPTTGEDGPDFSLIRGRDIGLFEVKSASPTFAVMEMGDVELLSKLLKDKIIPSFRKMPEKEKELLQGAWLKQRMPGSPHHVSHVVVTLGAFPAQRLWWGALAVPHLTAPPWRHSGPPYDIARPHHLVSVELLEDATTDRVPHLLYLLDKTWAPGWRHELSEEMERIRPVPEERHHPYLDPILDAWHAHYRNESTVTEAFTQM